MERDTSKLRDRFEGCLLAGAAGDALGYAIEFWGEGEIFGRFGKGGIQTLEQAAAVSRSSVAHFSDDTQMTLFTANGLTYGMDRTGAAPQARDIWLAYQEWLGTQGDESRMDDPAHPKMWLYGEPSLHALRAPGGTCLGSLRTSRKGGTPERRINGSKGCGGVMRVAPIGLLASVRDDVDALRLGAEAAALTHGHPLGWLPAAFLASLVERLVLTDAGNSAEGNASQLKAAIMDTLTEIEERFSDVYQVDALSVLVTDALRLAEQEQTDPQGDLWRIHQLGEGWVGEEALAIALYATLSHADDIAATLRAAVNHKGDSDSTGAIAGNILGALVGRTALEEAFDLTQLEEPALIIKVADSLLDHEPKEVVQ